MTDADRGAVVATLVLVALVAVAARARAAPVGITSLDPIEPVGGIGNTDPTAPVYSSTAAQLCACAPLESFGPACEGYTWVRVPTLSLTSGGAVRVELRDRIPIACHR